MSCALCTKRGIPCLHSSTITNACDACQQGHKKCLFIVRSFLPHAQDALARTPLWPTMMKPFLSRNGRLDPKQADRNDSKQLALSPQVSICAPPLLGHHPIVTSLLDPSKVIIRPMKDGNGKRIFKLGPIVTMSCHPCDSKAKQPTPGPSGTQWSEESFRKLPIPGPSPSSEPPEDVLTREPEPEVAPMQSMEEPFGKQLLHFFNSSQLFLTFSLTISSLSCHSPLSNYHQQYARPIRPSLSLPPRTHQPPPPRCPAPLIPTMMLTRNSPTCNQH
ncbi:hypothetical protein O181_066498 [Austropuccinia psidii MF-1]|uniref:Zn(2)-C6 fungal-type domain-containing protein n=1 Tax=Austropuccinia psidii MF-1 TaxID=1389203 RepID=A0A9Q3EX83_9BASI|nr:hypothetical protein [Austropuccinia psidii MF-1]